MNEVIVVVVVLLTSLLILFYQLRLCILLFKMRGNERENGKRSRNGTFQFISYTINTKINHSIKLNSFHRAPSFFVYRYSTPELISSFVISFFRPTFSFARSIWGERKKAHKRELDRANALVPILNISQSGCRFAQSTMRHDWMSFFHASRCSAEIFFSALFHCDFVRDGIMHCVRVQY